MKKGAIGALVLGLVSFPALALAQAQASDASSEVKDALDEVQEATQVVHKMQAQDEASKLLDQAKGVFILPDYGRAALGVGGSGGQGVLLAKHDGGWSDPVFYNVGSVNLGLEAGVSAGQVAMILMTDKAVNSFKGNNTFSLNADAEFTVVNYSARGQASLGKADIVMWSDVEGGFIGASVGASAISADEDANGAYYGTAKADPSSILSGTISKARPEARQLKDALNS